MRRGSIVGPLILIVIGTVFLLRNFIPNFGIMEIVSLYWPWLLILWGSLRVIEILIWHRNGQLSPRSGLHAGEWFLVVVLCLLGSGMYAARNAKIFHSNGIHLPNWEFLGERFDYPISGVQADVGKTPRIVIDNPRGNARVIASDSEEVRVTGSKTIRAISREDSDKEDKATGFELVKSGDQIMIRTNVDRAATSRQVHADLEITVPRGASIEGRGKFGDFDIENISGAVDINSDNAGVRLANIGGDVRVDLRRSDRVRVVNAKGSVEIKGRGQDVELENIAGVATVSGQYSGEMKFQNLAKPFHFETQNSSLRVERVEGEVELHRGRLSGRRLTGPIQITSKSKDIELSDFTGTVEIDVERGDIELRPSRLPLSKITARTRSGNAELVLPPGAKVNLNAEVKRGQIENSFGAPFKLTEDGRAATLAGSNGGPEVKLDVDRGAISVRSNAQSRYEPQEPPSPPKPPRTPLAEPVQQ